MVMNRTQGGDESYPKFFPSYYPQGACFTSTFRRWTTSIIWGLIPMSTLHPHQRLLRWEWETSDAISRSFSVSIEKDHGTVGAQTGVLLHLFPASLGWSSPRSPIFWFALSNHLQVALFSLSTWNWLPCVAVNICWQHWVPPSFFRSSFVHSVGEQGILLQFLHFRPQITHTQLFGLLTRADKGLGCTINFLILMYHISVEVYWKFTGRTGY